MGGHFTRRYLAPKQSNILVLDRESSLRHSDRKPRYEYLPLGQPGLVINLLYTHYNILIPVSSKSGTAVVPVNHCKKKLIIDNIHLLILN